MMKTTPGTAVAMRRRARVANGGRDNRRTTPRSALTAPSRRLASGGRPRCLPSSGRALGRRARDRRSDQNEQQSTRCTRECDAAFHDAADALTCLNKLDIAGNDTRQRAT